MTSHSPHLLLLHCRQLRRVQGGIPRRNRSPFSKVFTGRASALQRLTKYSKSLASWGSSVPLKGKTYSTGFKITKLVSDRNRSRRASHTSAVSSTGTLHHRHHHRRRLYLAAMVCRSSLPQFSQSVYIKKKRCFFYYSLSLCQTPKILQEHKRIKIVLNLWVRVWFSLAINYKSTLSLVCAICFELEALFCFDLLFFFFFVQLIGCSELKIMHSHAVYYYVQT